MARSGACRFLVLALLALALAFLVWYPGPLPKAVGIAGIFFMMLGIDVVLGPLPTDELDEDDARLAGDGDFSLNRTRSCISGPAAGR